MFRSLVVAMENQSRITLITSGGVFTGTPVPTSEIADSLSGDVQCVFLKDVSELPNPSVYAFRIDSVIGFSIP